MTLLYNMYKPINFIPAYSQYSVTYRMILTFEILYLNTDTCFSWQSHILDSDVYRTPSWRPVAVVQATRSAYRSALGGQ